LILRCVKIFRQGEVVRARSIEAFLHRTLGGRAEGASVADWAAAWID